MNIHSEYNGDIVWNDFAPEPYLLYFIFYTELTAHLMVRIGSLPTFQ